MTKIDKSDGLKLVQAMEGTMNYTLARFLEGKVKNQHLVDIIKLWALTYKQIVMMSLVEELIDKEDKERAVLRLAMISASLIPETRLNSDRLDLLMDELIIGRKEDVASSRIQD